MKAGSRSSMPGWPTTSSSRSLIGVRCASVATTSADVGTARGHDARPRGPRRGRRRGALRHAATSRRKPLEPRVVRPGAQQRLRVAVDDRAARAPQAVPDEQVVPCGRIVALARARPISRPVASRSATSASVEGQRVVAVEDEHAVVGISGRGVGPGHDVRPANAAERVRRRPGLRMAERVALGGRDLGREVRGRRARHPSAGATRSGAKSVASPVARLATLITVCSRTASTEPKTSTQPRLHLGGRIGARARPIRTSRRRSARSFAAPGRGRWIRAGRPATDVSPPPRRASAATTPRGGCP